MHRLILLRHGKAESVSATDADFDRGLTDRGRRDSALIGRVLANAGVVPDLVLVSAARRALETWEEVSRAFPAARFEIIRSLYLAGPEQISQAADSAAEGVSVMIIGHNPGLHEFVLAKADAAQAKAAGLSGFPTAAAAVFRLDPPKLAVLEGFFLPREYGGGPA